METDLRSPYSIVDIMWSKKDYPIKKIRDFVASHKTKLAKRGDMLNEKRLIKFQLVEKRFLSDDHIRSMMGASLFSFCSFLPLLALFSFPLLLFIC